MLSHKEEGIKYFCLHSFHLSDLPQEYKTPELDEVESDYRLSINNLGYLCAIFDDIDIAKLAVKQHILGLLYPRSYILEDDESKEWADFLRENGEGIDV